MLVQCSVLQIELIYVDKTVRKPRELDRKAIGPLQVFEAVREVRVRGSGKRQSLSRLPRCIKNLYNR